MKYKITPETSDNIESIIVKRVAKSRPIIQLEDKHTSLGPFVRITQDKSNRRYVYVLAYFNKKVNRFIVEDSFPRITIIAEKSTNIKKKRQDLLCFIIYLKEEVKFGEKIDVEIDFNQKKEGGVGEPTRGTVATPPVKD